MKLVKRLFTVILILLVLLLAAAVAVPIIYKKDIVNLIKTDINASIDAQVDFNENIKVKILPSFPNLSVEIKDISIVGINMFVGDTLAACSKLSATIGLKELFQNQKVDLQYIALQQPHIQLIATDSSNNWSVVKTTDTETSELQISADFEKIIIEDGTFTYADISNKTEVALTGISGLFRGNYAQDTFDLTSQFDCIDALIAYDNIPYVYHLPIKTDAITSINLATEEYQFKENKFWAGSIELSAAGGLKFIGDSIKMDIAYESNKASFQDLLSLVPAYYKEDLNEITSTGRASVLGTIDGIISDHSFPSYTFQMKLKNGTLAHTQLPEKIENVHLDLEVENKDGEDNSLVISLNQFGFNFQETPFNGQLHASDLYRDPLINGLIKGKLLLDKLSPILPKSLKTTLAGSLDCDLSINGRMSNIESSNVQRINTKGELVATNVIYDNQNNPNPIIIKNGHLNFTENDVNVPVMDINAGKSDLMVTGVVSNLLGYIFNNQVMPGNLTISSTLLDVNDFLTPTEEDLPDSNETYDLPDNMDVNMVYNIDEFQYTTHTFEAIKGSCTLSGKELTVNQLSTNCLEGQLVLNGSFNTTDPTKPLADLNVIVQDLNIVKAFTNFETIRLLAPAAEYVKGKFSSTLHLKTALLSDFSPDLSNITCQGVLDLFDCDIEGLRVVNDIGHQLRLTSFMEPLKIKDLLMRFSIKDGKIEVDPFTLPVGESTLNMFGYSKLDNSINFNGLLSIPKKLYQTNQDNFKSYIPKNQLSGLDSFEWSDLEFDVLIQGEVKNPTVKLDYKSTKKKVVDNVKSQIKTKVDTRKADLKKQAEEELNKAKQEAAAAKKAAEDRAKAAIEEQKRKLAEQVAKEKAAANKKIEDELKKKKEELLKKKLPLPPK
jgi:hypothetical protein